MVPEPCRDQNNITFIAAGLDYPFQGVGCVGYPLSGIVEMEISAHLASKGWAFSFSRIAFTLIIN